ncbi:MULTISPECIES: hypothetical protein [Streptomyces]|uniref:Ig-like domain-containing protein n=1 Tax=Streptomyces viridochromogenes TaxID=1938 RepID=A0A0L8LBY0_STRVR|nr:MULTISPECIES: hypothetical protein [Streptomyces]KOG35632.1 hypothetical protein ADK34_04740 [Streptomyces viridochromogenes]
MNDDDYSATELGSHWFEGPLPEPTPDRVEGEVLRFGPGVTAIAARRAENTPTAAQIWQGTLPGAPPPPPPRPRSRWPWRYVPAALVLVAVLAFLAWREYGPRAAVRSVAVTAPGPSLGCDGTANVVGVVRTDGRPGTLTYHWERSDGTRSAPLRETLARGQEEARLHLLWTFHGPGSHQAVARLVITSPTPHTAEGAFTYRCG